MKNNNLRKILIIPAVLLIIGGIVPTTSNIHPVHAMRFSYRGLPARTKKEVNSFYKYARTPAIRHSRRFIQHFYRNGAYKIYCDEKKLASDRKTIRHDNWLIRRYRHYNHHYVHFLKKQIKFIRNREANTSQYGRLELLDAEHKTYNNYNHRYHQAQLKRYNQRIRRQAWHKYKHSKAYQSEKNVEKINKINTPGYISTLNNNDNDSNSDNNAYPEMVAGKHDAHELFSGPTPPEQEDILHVGNIRTSNDLANPYYRQAFIHEASAYDIPTMYSRNVLVSYNVYHLSNYNSDFNDGWYDGTYNDIDEGLTESNEASNSNFQNGWRYGNIVYNSGNPDNSQSDWHQFMYQVNHPIVSKFIK